MGLFWYVCTQHAPDPRSPWTQREAPMKAVRLHRYHERPSVDEIEEPKIQSPLDVIVRIGGAGLCRTTGEFFREWGLPGSRFVAARSDGGDPP